VLIATACGSSPLSATDLRQRANLICSRADRQISTIATPASQAAGQAFLEQGTAALGPELSGLKPLQPPSDETVVYRSAITALSGELDALRAAVSGLDQGTDPVKTFRALQDKLGPLETQADNAWRALGVQACLSR
jgi:hypothetical protein